MSKTYQLPKEGVSYPETYQGGSDVSGTVQYGGSPVNTTDETIRLAGGLGALFSPVGGTSLDDIIKQSTKELEKIAKKTEKKIYENIYGSSAFTGETTADAMQRYYDLFSDTTQNLTAAGMGYLSSPMDLSSSYNILTNRVSDTQNQFSLANQLGGFSTIASQGAAPGQVTKMDVDSIRDVVDWVDPNTNQIKAEYKAYYDYSDPQTQQFIYGSRERPAAVAGFYANSGDVAGLMNYGNLSM